MGESFAARVAASLLNAIGLPELITKSQEEYEAKALALAMQPELLKELRDKLASNRLTQPVFNTPLFTKQIQDAYTAMHERHQAGLAPEHMNIGD
jgi:predicted O-linked N-acetylglucosamine transferase (SPINDLY family)